MRYTPAKAALAAIIISIVWTAPASALFVDSIVTPTVLSGKSGALALHFLPNVTGELLVEFVSNEDPRRGAPTPKRFRIIDNTLLGFGFTPSIRANDPLMIRVGFSGRAIRAGLRRAGLRANDLRVLRFSREGRWQRVRALRRNTSASDLKAAVATPDPLVWSITPESGGLFAVGLRVIPEPATFVLAGLGGLLLLGTRRDRSPV